MQNGTTRNTRAQLPPFPNSLLDGPLGIPPADTQDALKADHYKELINKVAWCLGTAYGRPYSSINQPARQYALMVAGAIIRDNGFPSSLAK